jgi:hypothetical protein
VSIVKTSADGLFDGAVTVPNIYWAVFMPSNQVFSDPKTFELFLFNNELSGPSRTGWHLSVNFITGRVFTNQGNFLVP